MGDAAKAFIASFNAREPRTNMPGDEFLIFQRPNGATLLMGFVGGCEAWHVGTPATMDGPQ